MYYLEGRKPSCRSDTLLSILVAFPRRNIMEETTDKGLRVD
jgi:hypothetical protein